MVKRYKRFLVDAVLEDGTEVTAHCPNTGSMKGITGEGRTIYLTKHDDPKRKLAYTLEIVDVDGALVGVNTGRPNKLVANAITQGKLEDLQGYSTLKPEQKYGTNSRIDLLLTDEEKGKCFIEVKNVTLKEGDEAQFPDAVTTRGAKHLDDLMAEVENGHRAVMFYLAQRNDCSAFNVAAHIDPEYAARLKRAMDKGVEAMAWACKLTPQGIDLARPLPLKLS